MWPGGHWNILHWFGSQVAVLTLSVTDTIQYGSHVIMPDNVASVDDSLCRYLVDGLDDSLSCYLVDGLDDSLCRYLVDGLDDSLCRYLVDGLDDSLSRYLVAGAVSCHLFSTSQHLDT